MKHNFLIRFTGKEEMKLYEWLKKESFESGLPMAEIARRGLELYKNQKEAYEVAKKLGYQVIEDNGGGLHLAVFDSDDKCIWYTSGLERLPVTDVQEMLQALQDGTDPVQDGWESDLPDDYTPQQLYDELTSYEYGWQIIADDAGVYPERMGAAGRIVFGLDD